MYCRMLIRLVFLKEDQGSIYLIINTVKTVIFWNIISISNKCFYCNIFVNVIYSCDAALNIQHHSSSLQCHMIFRNHSNILIYCSRHISDYYQCYYQNSFCFFIFLWKLWCIFQDSLTNRTFKKCFKLEILCNIINVFAVIFFINLMHPCCMVRCINFLKKSYWPQTFQRYLT